MRLGIVRLYAGVSGEIGYYNIQEIGLAKALSKKGICTDIFFLVNKNKEIIIKEINKKVRVIYIPSKKIFNHGIISPEFILNYDIDIVHLLSDNQLMVPTFIKFCNKHNIPIYNYVGTINSDTNNKFKKFIMSILEKRNIKWFKKSKLIAKTPTVKKELESRKVENVKVIPVGLDLDIIPQLKIDKVQIREQLNIPINKKVIIFVGRLENYKNPIKSIELMKKLKEISNEYFLIIIGQGSLKNKIVDLIKNYNLEKDILLIDKLENSKIHKYYKASDIFINLNDKEIFGMSILEAMYQGCNVIAIDAPGPKFIIDNKINGIIMKNYDLDKWINSIKENIENKCMSKLANRKVIDYFNWDSIATEYQCLFKVIKEK
ncbi:glycosyltransferase [Clostridium perfringens]|uniref:glycosyltransferase n=1 Tax=Clostridium perfringens TaxID=1502 RepID=UPI003AF59DAB